MNKMCERKAFEKAGASEGAHLVVATPMMTAIVTRTTTKAHNFFSTDLTRFSFFPSPRERKGPCPPDSSTLPYACDIFGLKKKRRKWGTNTKRAHAYLSRIFILTKAKTLNQWWDWQKRHGECLCPLLIIHLEQRQSRIKIAIPGGGKPRC